MSAAGRQMFLNIYNCGYTSLIVLCVGVTMDNVREQVCFYLFIKWNCEPTRANPTPTPQRLPNLQTFIFCTADPALENKASISVVVFCFRNRQRMHFAIKHLIEEPQNNFKVFKVSSVTLIHV